MSQEKKTLIRRVNSDDKISQIFVGKDTKIHNTAKVRNEAVICNGAKIASLAYVGEKAVIGNRSTLETGATVDRGVILGADVVVKKFGRASSKYVPKGTVIKSGEIY